MCIRDRGYTGGTIDKLESIPGFRTALSIEEAVTQVNQIGVCIIGPVSYTHLDVYKRQILRGVLKNRHSVRHAGGQWAGRLLRCFFSLGPPVLFFIEDSASDPDCAG